MNLKYDLNENKIVLVVDDEEMIRDLALDILDSVGIQSLEAKDGEEAMLIYKNNSENIDAILLDIMMPKKDGSQVFEEIRKLNPKVKIIVQSGFAESEKIQKIRAGSNVEFLHKPYPSEQLIETVSKVINEK